MKNDPARDLREGYRKGKIHKVNDDSKVLKKLLSLHLLRVTDGAFGSMHHTVLQAGCLNSDSFGLLLFH